MTITDYDQAMFRTGWHINQINYDNDGGVLKTISFTPLGGGYYTLGPLEYDDQFTVNSLFLGARFAVAGFLISTEVTAVLSNNIDPAPNTMAAYVNCARKIGNWTPYLTYAQSWSDGIDTWRKVKGATPVPQMGIISEDIADLASSMAIYEQSSLMLGTSYAFTPRQKVKLEAMLTHVGDRSAMFDGDIADENVMVCSLSYNFSF